MLQALGLAALAPAMLRAVSRAAVAAADSAVTNPGLPLIVRRVLIPAPGATLPAVLIRPAALGRFPAMILPAVISTGEPPRALAAAGRVVLETSGGSLGATDRAAVERYLSAHPAVSGVAEFLPV
jgi:anti-sigma factor RsiW